MELRLANINDLSQLQDIYKKLIMHMDENGIQIWDDIYPCVCFPDDMTHKRLYILVENNVILAAFSLCESCLGETCVQWKNQDAKALYLDRFGVNIDYLRKGIGSLTLQKAINLTRDKGYDYLRLFVVDVNQPAIQLYIKNGFQRVEGIYDEVIDDELVLHEYGFEMSV